MKLLFPDELVNIYQARDIVTTIDLAACCIFLWDYLITLDLEVDLIWQSETSYLKILYLIQRYLPFIDALWLGLRNSISTSVSAEECRVSVVVQSVLMVVGVMTSEMILTVRTWSVWDRRPSVGYLLAVLYVVFWGANIGLLTVFLKPLIHTKFPFDGFRGCVVWGASLPIFVGWMVVFIWNALLTTLMIIPGVGLYQVSGTSKMFNAVYRDGVLYYVYLLILSLLNMVISMALPLEYQPVLNIATRCLHSTLTSRAVLHIRLLPETEESDDRFNVSVVSTTGRHVAQVQSSNL